MQCGFVVDFRYQGVRCRETTNLEATTQNRKLLKKRLEQLDAYSYFNGQIFLFEVEHPFLLYLDTL